jgi:hypothetical protein
MDYTLFEQNIFIHKQGICDCTRLRFKFEKLQFQQVVFLILIGGIDFFNLLDSDWWKHDSAGISTKKNVNFLHEL